MPSSPCIEPPQNKEEVQKQKLKGEPNAKDGLSFGSSRHRHPLAQEADANWELYVVFGVTFMAFASFHIVRKGYICSKMMLEEQWGITKREMGFMDTCFLVFYAIGLTMSGRCADTYGAKSLLVLGMIGSIIIQILFGFARIMQLDTLWFLLLLRGFEGIAHSTGWPCAVVIKLLSSRLESSPHRGRWFGYWGANPWVGNILGSMLVSFLIECELDLFYLFLVPALVMSAMLLVVLLMIEPDGDNNNNGITSRKKDEEVTQNSQTSSSSSSSSVSWCEAVMLPGLWSCCSAYACLKLVEYTLFFWTPLYLHDHLCVKCSQSGYVSNAHDVGLILGGVLGGMMSDSLGGARAITSATMMLTASASLLLFVFVNKGIFMIEMIALLFLSGLALGGPVVMLSSVIAGDLALKADTYFSKKQDGDSRSRGEKQGQGKMKLVATFNGLICGSGNMGSAVGQVSLPFLLLLEGGWHVVYMLLAAMCIASILFLYRPILADWETIVAKQRRDKENHYHKGNQRGHQSRRVSNGRGSEVVAAVGTVAVNASSRDAHIVDVRGLEAKRDDDEGCDENEESKPLL
eukprot:jgi/Bigna1/68104/fgenesh1_pg.5_\